MPPHFRQDAERTRSLPGTVWHAAEVGDLPQLQAHVQRGLRDGQYASITLQQQESVQKMMPLHIAAEAGQAEVVQYLISQRVDLDAGTLARVTALHLAAWSGQIEVATLLLKARAVVTPQDTEGDMPIHWAASKNQTEMIQLLVRNKSPVDPANKQGWTPLHRATHNGHVGALELLVKLGASVNSAALDGNTALHWACSTNNIRIIRILLAYGARKEAVNEEGNTPYDLCISGGARDVFQDYGFFGTPRPSQGSKDPSHEPKTQQLQQQDQSQAEVAAAVMLPVTSLLPAAAAVQARANRALTAQAQDDDFPDVLEEEAYKRTAVATAGQTLGALISQALQPSNFLAEAAPHAVGRLASEARGPYSAASFSEAPSHARSGLQGVTSASVADRAGSTIGTSGSKPYLARLPSSGSHAAAPARASVLVRSGSLGASAIGSGGGVSASRALMRASSSSSSTLSRGRFSVNSGPAALTAAKYRSSAPSGNRPLQASSSTARTPDIPAAADRPSAPATGRSMSHSRSSKKFLAKYGLQNLSVFTP